MSSSPNSINRAASRADQKWPRRRPQTPQLNQATPCDTAFRVIARSCLADLTANHEATCRGGRAALHEMRIALTRLRAAMAFFSPMATDSCSVRLKRELKWLNAHLGTARDLDVAIERVQEIRERSLRAVSNYRSWKQKGVDSHRDLTRDLRSERYWRLIKDTSDWVVNGPWSTATDKQVAKRRACRIDHYSTRKLAQWRKKLLKKSRRLEDMGAKKRHRLRLANKRLRYSLEFFAGLVSDKSFSTRATLKYLRRAQEALGELNDAAEIQALGARAFSSEATGGETSPFLDRKREGRLIRSAVRAYRKMDALKPLCL